MRILADMGSALHASAFHGAAVARSVALCALLLAIAGCAVVDNVSLDFPPGPPVKGSVGACGATPVALAHLSGIMPHVMLIDELNLYVLTSSGADSSVTQSLWRIPKDGSSPQRMMTSETPVAGISLDSVPFLPEGPGLTSAVYWTTSGIPDVDGGPEGVVMSIGLAATDKPVVFASNRRSPGALTRIGSSLYWAEQDIGPSGQVIETIVESSTPGGPVTRVQTLDADQVPQDVAAYEVWVPELDASVGSLVWTTWNSRVGSESTAEVVECPLPAPMGSKMRITGPDAGGSAAMNLDPVMPAVLYSGPKGITEVALMLDGGLGAPRLIAATGGFVDDIESDDTDVYFVDPATRSLVAVPRSAAVAQLPRTIVGSIDPATPFLVDDACVYSIDARAETITMVMKRPAAGD